MAEKAILMLEFRGKRMTLEVTPYDGDCQTEGFGHRMTLIMDIIDPEGKDDDRLNQFFRLWQSEDREDRFGPGWGCGVNGSG
jgi:hypothetical protein